MLISGLIGVIYIFNPTAGFIELIPDNLPIIGNLDEAAAVILVISALRYFGFDVTNIFNKKESSHSPDKIPRDIDS
ncbi:MAG: DUF1232 domain-containing protein [Bacteriovoracaceae bacterium]|nr:DUF1232 domain-containing protein [Bacteriovoracaceae bacterium]